ncbi:hypothetical protein H8356DRAFT_1356800 [Neocallimastix lanati (nom. inval.)]|nr:hypothetical protein H8356DRAFT_1356800 [Neocallimastix sp. JGI-2020a]
MLNSYLKCHSHQHHRKNQNIVSDTDSICSSNTYCDLYEREEKYIDKGKFYSVNIKGKDNKDIKNSERPVNNEKNENNKTKNFFNSLQFMSPLNKEICHSWISNFDINSFDDEKKNINLWASNLTPELNHKLIRIPEIKEAIEICKTINIEEETYNKSFTKNVELLEQFDFRNKEEFNCFIHAS